MAAHNDPNLPPISVCGDPADPTEIADMEGLARIYAGEGPAELSREYRYEARGGETAIFATYIQEDKPEDGILAALALASDVQADAKVVLTFGFNDEEPEISFSAEDSYEEVTSLAKTVLGECNLRDIDERIVRQLLSILEALDDGCEPVSGAIPEHVMSSDDLRSIADAIRVQVSERAKYVEHTRNRHCQIGIGATLVVTTATLEGWPDEDDDKLYATPQLEIILIDGETVYSYLRPYKGKPSLATEMLKDRAMPSTDPQADRLVNELMSDLDDGVPGKIQIGLLRGVLDRAIAQSQQPDKHI